MLFIVRMILRHRDASLTILRWIKSWVAAKFPRFEAEPRCRNNPFHRLLDF
jgi:hypothetical protein